MVFVVSVLGILPAPPTFGQQSAAERQELRRQQRDEQRENRRLSLEERRVLRQNQQQERSSRPRQALLPPDTNPLYFNEVMKKGMSPDQTRGSVVSSNPWIRGPDANGEPVWIIENAFTFTPPGAGSPVTLTGKDHYVFELGGLQETYWVVNEDGGQPIPVARAAFREFLSYLTSRHGAPATVEMDPGKAVWLADWACDSKLSTKDASILRTLNLNRAGKLTYRIDGNGDPC